MGRRQDLLVVRELSVDQAADDVGAFDVEEDLALGAGEHDVDRIVRVCQHAHQLGVGTCRHHEARVLDRVDDRQAADGDDAVVRRGQRQLVARQRVRTPVKMGRASSVAAANTTSDSARLSSFWLTRVVGRSPGDGMTGNSSASIPRSWVW